MPISTTDLNKAYLAYFGRPADFTGLSYFSTLEEADVIAAFDASAESQALYGNDLTAKVNAIYNNLFNRDAEPAGLQWWVEQITIGNVTPAGAAFAILNGAQGTDATAVENKLAAAEAFVAALDTTAEIVGYSGLAAGASARTWLKAVGEDEASLAAAVAGVDAAVGAAAGTAQGGSNEAGSSYVLTTNQDILTGTAKNDFFRAVAGQRIGDQDQTTLNSSDIIDGGDGNDTLVVNLNGNYGGGARLKNIETLQLGSNVATASFDYNVNAGQNEITEVQTVVFDQINQDETLSVANLLKTGDVLPTLAWRNEAGSIAGVTNTAYRASAVAGATEQKIELSNVTALNTAVATTGVLNIGAGVETFHVVSTGAAANTLNIGTKAADLVSGTNDLKTVIISGDQAFGKKAGIITANGANQGLVNRDVATDLGLDTTATASNLASVQASVTKVDASANTAGVNVRFTNTASVDATFVGSAAADYVEFQLGNINANGGAGDDVFAFVTTSFLNGTFGSSDTIVGGEGTDTIQLGVNGVGNFALGTTEFNNKSGIEVLDVRAATSNITLQDAFVGASDNGKFVVQYDRAVQTSDTNAANPVGGATAENDAVNVLNLTALGANRAIEVVGGSGSERLVLNDVSFNQYLKADLGTNVNTAGTAAAAGDYDTITVLNSAVIDRADLAGIKGVEAFGFAKQGTGVASFTLELTEAFLLANTQAADSATTSIADNVFVLTTGAYAGGAVLAANDVVRIDISDLVTTDANGDLVAKNALVGRAINTEALSTAGATVEFIYNGNVLVAGAAGNNTADLADIATLVVTGTAATAAADLLFA